MYRMMLMMFAVLLLASCSSRWPINDVNLESLVIEKREHDGSLFLWTDVEPISVNSARYPVCRIVDDSENAILVKFESRMVGANRFMTKLDGKNIRIVHVLFLDDNDKIVYFKKYHVGDMPIYGDGSKLYVKWNKTAQQVDSAEAATND